MTVRRVWKSPARKGDRLYLHVDLSKQKTIVVTACCSDTYPVHVSSDSVRLRNRKLSPTETQRFLRKDGFRTFSDMVAFFEQRYSLPFIGQCIQWSTLRPRLDKPEKAQENRNEKAGEESKRVTQGVTRFDKEKQKTDYH